MKMLLKIAFSVQILHVVAFIDSLDFLNCLVSNFSILTIFKHHIVSINITPNGFGSYYLSSFICFKKVGKAIVREESITMDNKRSIITLCALILLNSSLIITQAKDINIVGNPNGDITDVM